MPKHIAAPALIAVAVLAGSPARAPAQGPRLGVRPAVALVHTATRTAPARPLRLVPEGSRRETHALIGALIGGATGLLACTVISTIADDAAKFRISTCTWKGYLALGGGGLVLGGLIGALIP